MTSMPMPTPAVDPQLIADRVGELRALVDRHAVTAVRIVGVTKRFDVEVVRAALAAGLVDLGENYAQELLAKATALDADPAAEAIRWHFIGHLQRNKVRSLADVVDLWQTVDSVRLGQEIASRHPGAHVLVQVNASGTAGQSGVDPVDVPSLVESLRREPLRVEGLMTIGAMGDPAASRDAFGRVHDLAEALELPERSMGMSSDLVEALESGSTMVRVGTALFGSRPSH